MSKTHRSRSIIFQHTANRSREIRRSYHSKLRFVLCRSSSSSSGSIYNRERRLIRRPMTSRSSVESRTDGSSQASTFTSTRWPRVTPFVGFGFSYGDERRPPASKPTLYMRCSRMSLGAAAPKLCGCHGSHRAITAPAPARRRALIHRLSSLLLLPQPYLFIVRVRETQMAYFGFRRTAYR